MPKEGKMNSPSFDPLAIAIDGIKGMESKQKEH